MHDLYRANFENRVRGAGAYENDHDDGYIYDDYAVCADIGDEENVNPKRDAPWYRTFHAPVTSPEMQGMWDVSRVF